jgi:hypothetical protein
LSVVFGASFLEDLAVAWHEDKQGIDHWGIYEWFPVCVVSRHTWQRHNEDTNILFLE